MKRIALLMGTLVLLTLLSGCTEPIAYNLSDIVPPLMDIETQYPYVTEITVTDHGTGETLSFMEGVDHDRIRMQFEGIQCVRTKDSGRPDQGYTVRFITTEEPVEIFIAANPGAYQATKLYIGEYRYDLPVTGVDLTFFAGLFAE